MRQLGIHYEPPSTFQVFDDVSISRLYMLAFEVADDGRKAAGIVDGVGWWAGLADDAGGEGDAVIILTVRGGLVDDTHTAVCCDVCVVEDFKTKVLELFIQVVEERFVFESEQVPALQLLYNLELGLLRVLVERLQKRLEEDVVLARGFVEDLDILKIGMCAETRVRGQGPWSCRPVEGELISLRKGWGGPTMPVIVCLSHPPAGKRRRWRGLGRPCSFETLRSC